MRVTLPDTAALISDDRVTSIPISDCGEPIVQLACSQRLRVTKHHVSWNPRHAHVRQGVRDRLERAACLLPKGLSLVVEEGLREVTVQAEIYESYCRSIRDDLMRSSEVNSISDDEVGALASRYVARPSGTPPHSTGGAVDVFIAESSTTERLEFGSRSDDPPSVGDTRHHLWSKDVCATAAANRLLLASIMLRAGFVNYWTEWWHWSVGDQYWAYVTGHPQAFYAKATIALETPETGLLDSYEELR